MNTLREQFDAQCRQASFTSAFYGIELDVVMVRHKRGCGNTRISILGNAINRAAYEIWRNDNSQVRLLCVYGANGQKTKPLRKPNDPI